MRFYEARSTIAAEPEAIWSVLVDVPGYPTWDSGVERVEGRVALGERLRVFVRANPGKAFPVKVAALTPPTAMRWTGGMPLGLFTGTRTYSLGAQGDGTTTFTMREEYTGPLAGLIGKSIPDLQPAFDEFALCLKREAERR